MKRLHGLIAATVLPMDGRFRIDRHALKRYLRWLVDQGVHGMAVNVDTGEGPHLTQAERLLVIETAREAAGRIPVISGLSPSSTGAAVKAARELRSAGADALLVFPSSAFRGRPLPPEVPVRYYRAVGEGADVPLVLFQLQEALGGVEFPIDTLLAIARLEHVIAMKEATFDVRKYKATVAALKQSRSKITLLTGNDNFIYDSFRWGAGGALIGFGTLATRMQVDMVGAHERGDVATARRLGKRIQRLADVIFAPPVRDYRVRLKEALRMTGVIPSAAIREPLLPVSPAERKRIAAALRAAGIL